MRVFRTRKIFAILTAIVITAVIVGGSIIGYATFSKSLGGHVKIGQETVQDLGFFQDRECTKVLTVLDFGTVYVGKPATKEFFVKNTGNVDLDLKVYTDLDKNIGQMVFIFDDRTPQPGIGKIKAGAVADIKCRFQVDPNAERGTEADFNIIFEERSGS